jgi:hypothetical protein
VFNVLVDFPLQIDNRETRGGCSRRNSLLLQALHQTVQAALLLQGSHEDARTRLCRHLLQMRLLLKIVQDKAHFEEACENAQRRERLFRLRRVRKEVYGTRIFQNTHENTGEKPYVCDFCDKGFTLTKYLKTHVRVHTKEKPYSCDVCKKSFTQEGSLTIHKRDYTGERPYTCRVCAKGFVSKTFLNQHNCKGPK